MDHQEIERLFTGCDGKFRFARWGRPIAPVVFGTDDATLGAVKFAMQEVAGLANMKLAETDPELGANFMVFFCREWDELLAVPDLDKLLTDLPGLVAQLKTAGASQYRAFAFDAEGAIKMCTLVLRMGGALADQPVHALMTGQMAQTLLLWGPEAFAEASPVGIVAENNYAVVRPEVAALIRAAYDPAMPAAASDPSHALRLAARVNLLLEG